jgi:outer membrane immunogenic protein
MWRVGPGLVVALALAAAGVCPPAQAADMAPGPSYYPAAAAPMPPARYNWTGIYGGGQIGMDFLQDTATQTTTTLLQNSGNGLKVTPYGVIGGAQIGANYEFAPWVVGIEASWDSTYLTGATVGPALEPSVVGGVTQRFTSSPQWIATATGRLGYAANDLLFYAKGGAAWMRVDYTQEVLVGGIVSSTSLLTPTRTGFVVGGGIEYGLTEALSARIEYDFYDFGTANYTFSLVEPLGGTSLAMPTSIQSYVQAVTVGLNYRFNGFGGGFALPTY